MRLFQTNVKYHSRRPYARLPIIPWFLPDPGGRLNKKDGLTRYGNSHVKDKTS